MPKPRAKNRVFPAISGALALVMLALVGGAGCDELQARRLVQTGDELYQEGKYTEAIAKYEEALELAPDLTTAHHNAAVASYRAFQPGVQTQANDAYASKASLHFEAYLKEHPDDLEIIGLLTNIWLDSEQYDHALSYWHAQLEKRPKDVEVLQRLGTINRQAGRYDEALKWDYARADAATDDAHRVKAYIDIAQLQYSRLTKPELVDAERLAAADAGVAALQKAIALQPKNPDLYSLLGSLYQFRALTHYSSWARVIEAASQRHHQIQRNELVKALKEAQASAAASGQTPAEQGEEPKEK